MDDGGQAIGKRYARTDEIGIPFAITIDYDTLKDETVTLRELNTLKQVRIPVRIYILMIVKWGSEDNIWFIIIVCGMGVSFIEISKIRN